METHAWTTRAGATAAEAAGAIHSDFEAYFVRAEVCSYEEFVAAGGEKGVRAGAAGVRLRSEGRDYLMQPDEVVLEFKVAPPKTKK